MKRLKWMTLFLAVLGGMLWTTKFSARAAEFETFDGRAYNGKYYPRIDIIEWSNNPGEPSHMEFQVYWKGHPLEMSFELEEKNGKKVMLVNYYIPERKEKLCRRVLAPGHFAKGFIVYKDTSDKDMDNTIVTMVPLASKPGLTKIDSNKYLACTDEVADSRAPAANDGKNIAPPAADQKREHTDKGALKKQGDAVPFSNW
jgi:hypothetical protein